MVLIVAAMAACSGRDDVATSIVDHFVRSDRRAIDLDRAVPRPWKRVCILGPYTDNAAAHATLGLQWDSDKVSDIAMNDSIVLLVFVGDDNKVAFSTNYPRGDGDFSNLSRRCFARSQARFEQVDKPHQGWPGLFPRSA